MYQLLIRMVRHILEPVCRCTVVKLHTFNGFARHYLSNRDSVPHL